MQSSKISWVTDHSMWERIGLIAGWKSGESRFHILVNLTGHSLCKGIVPHVVQDYFEIVQQTVLQYSISPECMWTMDKSSFAFGRSDKIRVIGQIGERVRHSLQDGWNRETTTFMVLISAAGACMPPCVRFQGQKLNSIWSELENDPL